MFQIIGSNFGRHQNYFSIQQQDSILVEQIIAYVRKIVQIMMQATDLAQIVYRDHSSRKTRATQNFNMAAIFQDGRHELSRNPYFLP